MKKKGSKKKMEVLLFYVVVAVVVGLMCYTTKEFVELHKSKADLETSLEQARTALENRIKEDLYEYEQMEENYLRVSDDFKEASEQVEQLTEQVKELQGVELPTYTYTKEDIELLAKCVQAEAGVKNYTSQKMVTQVILNRVKSGGFPNTIKDVIYQKTAGNVPQFSVAYNGALDKQVVTPETYKNIYEVLMFGYEMPETVQFFYSSNLKKNNWVKTLEKYREVEGTVFCFNKKSKS